jgi:hypothetical protein
MSWKTDYLTVLNRPVMAGGWVRGAWVVFASVELRTGSSKYCCVLIYPLCISPCLSAAAPAAAAAAAAVILHHSPLLCDS